MKGSAAAIAALTGAIWPMIIAGVVGFFGVVIGFVEESQGDTGRGG